VEGLLRPVRTTDGAGVARFDALLPGRYRVAAAENGEERVRSVMDNWPIESHDRCGVAQGVPVSIGRTTTFRLAIYPQTDQAWVHVFRADGRPWTGEHERVGCGSHAGGGGWSVNQSLDDNGLGLIALRAAGLWRVDFHYRDSPFRWSPIGELPRYVAESVVAVSPRLPATKAAAARMTARREGPSSITVELQDRNGRPARGFVELGSWASEPQVIGATDERGIVRFEGVQPGELEASADLAGRPRVNLADYDMAVPVDPRFQDVFTVLHEDATVARDSERRVVLREQSIGFVRGTIKPPPGRSPREFDVALPPDAFRHGAQLNRDYFTGEFVAGPFAPGDVRLQLLCSPKGGGLRNKCGLRDVKVEAGRSRGSS
jgi:hypothetical protein